MLTLEYRMAMSMGEVVKYHRKRLGLTQEALAEKMGRNYTLVSKVEQGHTFRRLPDADEFRAWANALETPPEVMLAQLGYIGDEALDASKPKHPELVFTSLADEVRSAENMPAEVQESVLNGIRQARLIYDALKNKSQSHHKGRQ